MFTAMAVNKRNFVSIGETSQPDQCGLFLCLLITIIILLLLRPCYKHVCERKVSHG